MDNQEPQIYKQLRQLAEDVIHFEEILNLLAEKDIYINETDGAGRWQVRSEDASIRKQFPTFSQAFEFVIGLLKAKA